jgi:hypothetical protein
MPKQCLATVAACTLRGKMWPCWKAAPRQSSFHLATRNPKELVGMVDAWQRFSTAFAEPLRRANLTTDRVQQLGHRVAQHAKYISDQVSPGPNDVNATLAHGDYKA